MALGIIDLPVPGTPVSNTPRGIGKPNARAAGPARANVSRSQSLRLFSPPTRSSTTSVATRSKGASALSNCNFAARIAGRSESARHAIGHGVFHDQTFGLEQRESPQGLDQRRSGRGSDPDRHATGRQAGNGAIQQGREFRRVRGAGADTAPLPAPTPPEILVPTPVRVPVRPETGSWASP